MSDTIEVFFSKKSQPAHIEFRVFSKLVENSIISDYADIRRALISKRIYFKDLKDASKKAQIPLPLFFSPYEFVEDQVEHKLTILKSGVSFGDFGLAARGKVELREVELIITDLIHKKEFLKKRDTSLSECQSIGLIGEKYIDAESSADLIREHFEINLSHLYGIKTKREGLSYLIELIENKNILVSRSQRNFMLQILDRSNFSGFVVKDKKIPYIFLSGMAGGDYDEALGRQIFTLMLLLVLISLRKFTIVSLEDDSLYYGRSREYQIASTILLPKHELGHLSDLNFSKILDLSKKCKLTPSAVTVRLLECRIISPDLANKLLQEIKDSRPIGRRRSGVPNAISSVSKYASHTYLRKMFDLYDSGKISQKDFLRVATLNKINKKQIPTLKNHIYGSDK